MVRELFIIGRIKGAVIVILSGKMRLIGTENGKVISPKNGVKLLICQKTARYTEPILRLRLVS